MTYNLVPTIVAILFAVSLGFLKAGVIKYSTIFNSSRLKNINAYKKRRKDNPSYAKQIQHNGLGAAIGYMVSFFIFTPFVVTLEIQSLWITLLSFVSLVMVFDLFYYFHHRFILHGPLDKHHTIHHEHQDVCRSDGSYQHPLDTVIGLSLFGFTTFLVGVVLPLDFFCLGLWIIFFFEMGQYNHAIYDVKTFPFTILEHQRKSHRLHHEDNTVGNYGYLTMFYDWLFNTYSKKSS